MSITTCGGFGNWKKLTAEPSVHRFVLFGHHDHVRLDLGDLSPVLSDVRADLHHEAFAGRVLHERAWSLVAPDDSDELVLVDVVLLQIGARGPVLVIVLFRE